MALFFALAVLGVVVLGLLLLGWGAARIGVDSRPEFGDDERRFPEHHDFRGSF
jgi:hypothetical protein